MSRTTPAWPTTRRVRSTRPRPSRYARRAGDRSARLASRREAVAQYQRALRFAPADQPLLRAELLDRLGDELASLDDWSSATASLEESIELWRAEGVPRARGRRPPAAELCPVAHLPRPRGPGRRRRRPRRPRAARHLPRAGVGPGHLGEQRDAARGLRRGHGPTGRAPSTWPSSSSSTTSAATPSTPWRAWRPGPGGEWYPMLHESLTVALRHGPPHPGGTRLHQPRGHPDRPGALPGGGALLPRGRRVLRGARPGDVGAVPGRGARPTILLHAGRLGRPWRTSPPSPSPATARSPINRITFLVPLGIRGHGEGCPGGASCSRRRTRRPSPSTSPSGSCSPRPPWPRRTGCRRRRRRPRGPRRRAPRSPRPAPASGRWPRS